MVNGEKSDTKNHFEHCNKWKNSDMNKVAKTDTYEQHGKRVSEDGILIPRAFWLNPDVFPLTF